MPSAANASPMVCTTVKSGLEGSPIIWNMRARPNTCVFGATITRGAAGRIRHARFLLGEPTDKVAGEGEFSNRREVHNTHAGVGCGPILANHPVKLCDRVIGWRALKTEKQGFGRRIEFNC